MNVRRLDWHALLPGRPGDGPARWLLIGGDHDLANLAVELGLARSATTGSDSPGSADVVALLDGGTEPLERAVAALVPGGCLYWEIDRRSLGRAFLTPGRARRRLRAAGLTPLAMYWVGPSWLQANRFLPIEPRGPLAWYLGTSNAATGPVSWALRRVLRTIARRPGIVGLLVPRLAVVAASGHLPGDESPAALTDPAMPAAIRSSAVPPVLVTGGEEAWGRITLLAFASGEGSPGAVVKIARQAEFDGATRREHEVLIEVRSRVDEAMRTTIPEPLAVLEIGRHPAVVQSAARGSSVLARMSRWPHGGRQRRRDLELTTEWLIAFQAQTGRLRVAPGSPGWKTHVDAPLDRFDEAFGSRARVARLFARLQDHATTVAADLPIGLRHMDLGPWNVLIDGDRVNVIDWEVARDGLALSDIIYASVHWSFAANGGRSEPARRDHLRWLLANSTVGDPDRSSVHAAIHRCCAAIDMDPRLIRALVVLTFVDQALDRSSRLHLGGTPDQDPWTQNRYVGYIDEIASFDDGWITATGSSPAGARVERLSEAQRTPLSDSTSFIERR